MWLCVFVYMFICLHVCVYIYRYTHKPLPGPANVVCCFVLYIRYCNQKANATPKRNHIGRPSSISKYVSIEPKVVMW